MRAPYGLCEACDKPLTAGYAINQEWDKCLRCKIEAGEYPDE